MLMNEGTFVELAEKYAQQEAIGFAEWIAYMELSSYGKSKWITRNESEIFTTEQLYKLYTETK